MLLLVNNMHDPILLLLSGQVIFASSTWKMLAEWDTHEHLALNL